MSNPVKFQPDRYRTVTPNLVCKNAAGAIDFYKKVFGARELSRALGPNNTVMHAELTIGDSIIFLNDPLSSGPGAPAPGTPVPIYLHVYVEDVDATVSLAVQYGAGVEMPVQDQFWGDRYGVITDPFGQRWGVATHKEDVSPEEMQRRMQAMLSQSRGAAHG
jgi:PhnB protein